MVEKNDAHGASHVPVMDNRQAVITPWYEVVISYSTSGNAAIYNITR